MDHFQSSHNIFINWSQVPEALPEHLHQLYLESNSIDALPESFLGGFTQLQYVRIAHNQLTDKGIPANTFNVTGLVELDLSFNKLERIPPVSTTLQHLYLQANQIKGKCVLIVTLFTWLCMCSPLWFVVEGLSWKKKVILQASVHRSRFNNIWVKASQLWRCLWCLQTNFSQTWSITPTLSWWSRLSGSFSVQLVAHLVVHIYFIQFLLVNLPKILHTEPLKTTPLRISCSNEILIEMLLHVKLYHLSICPSRVHSG